MMRGGEEEEEEEEEAMLSEGRLEVTQATSLAKGVKMPGIRTVGGEGGRNKERERESEREREREKDG